MSRRPRLYLPSVPQHLVQRGHDRQACFRDGADCRAYLEWLAEGSVRFGCEVHAYVLMTNHVHLLLTGLSAEAIPDLMQSLGTRYVRHVNRRYSRSGTLWEGRYHASLVEHETHLLRCMRYIEANPVRAGMAATPAAWPWSSFRRNALGNRDDLVTPHASYLALGATDEMRHDAYRRLFDEILATDVIARIREGLHSGLPTGSAGFQRQVAEAFGPVAARGIRGRPPASRRLARKIVSDTDSPTGRRKNRV